jgi:Uma2 family endonuclease
MLVAEKKITIDEYMKMPIGAPYQYIDGYLIPWPSRTTLHQLVLGNIIGSFLNYEEENGGICPMGPIETILDEHNSFQPDFVYVTEERREIVKDYIYGAPDFVVEVLEVINAYYDLRPKKDIYEKYGVKEYLIIDPIQLTSELYVLKDGVYYLHQKIQKTDILRPAKLPNLIFDMNSVFHNTEKLLTYNKKEG